MPQPIETQGKLKEIAAAGTACAMLTLVRIHSCFHCTMVAGHFIRQNFMGGRSIFKDPAPHPSLYF